MREPPFSSTRFSNIAALENKSPATDVFSTRDAIVHGAGTGSVKGKIMDIEFDGSKTLLEQQTAINYFEQTENLQIICYQKGMPPLNSAWVKRMPKGQTILPLLLLELPSSTSVGAVVAEQLASGRHLVFYSAVHVKGVETKVAGFR
jgi:hypothetical protein